MNKKILFILISLVLVFAKNQNVEAETIIGDTFLTNDTVWDVDHSPYIISGAITVGANARLIIDPGVTVDMDPNAQISQK